MNMQQFIPVYGFTDGMAQVAVSSEPFGKRALQAATVGAASATTTVLLDVTGVMTLNPATLAAGAIAASLAVAVGTGIQINETARRAIGPGYTTPYSSGFGTVV